jgi:hypothetical protein
VNHFKWTTAWALYVSSKICQLLIILYFCGLSDLEKKKVFVTVNPSKFRPNTNFGPFFFPSFVAFFGKILYKIEQNQVGKSTVFIFLNVYCLHFSAGCVLIIANCSETKVQSIHEVHSERLSRYGRVHTLFECITWPLVIWVEASKMVVFLINSKQAGVHWAVILVRSFEPAKETEVYSWIKETSVHTRMR